jgi:hypothetical protein
MRRHGFFEFGDLYRKAAGLDYEFLAACEVDKAKADASGVIADV